MPSLKTRSKSDKYKRWVLGCVAVIALIACDNDSNDYEITSAVTIGDSIGNGFGVATPWPTLIQGALSISIDNTSVSGQPTAFGVRVIEDLLHQNDPSHVLILLGTNDAIRGSVDTAVANLQAMVNIANRNNVIVVIGTIPPIPANTIWNQRAAEISNAIRGLNNVKVAEIRSALGEDESLFVDGIHPSTPGQQLIADTFVAAIVERSQAL